jgi:dihydrofolate synthase/folylpolyglutamate synthase
LLKFHASAFWWVKKYSKNLDTFLFFYNTRYCFGKPDHSKGLSAAVLQEKIIQFDLIGKKDTLVKEALNSALLDANQQDIIYVGGSTFVVAEII